MSYIIINSEDGELKKTDTNILSCPKCASTDITEHNIIGPGGKGLFTSCNSCLYEDNFILDDNQSKTGVKNDAGKPKLSLVSYESIAGEARALEYGLTKYGKNNYKLGMEWSRLLDATGRHLFAFSHGEDIDSDSKLNHLYHAKANLGMLIYYYEKKLGKDDR
jgi:hypothetical protein